MSRDLEPALAPPAPKRRVRKPSLASQAKQLWKGARAAGISVAMTIEGDKLTATPVTGTAGANSDLNEWDRDFGTNSPSLRQ
jgi:hypothetical protein